MHDGYIWTYNSQEAFSNLFPYFSPKKVGNLLRKMEKNGIIKSGNYNHSPYDRTKWYTLPWLFEKQEKQDETSIVQNGTMQENQKLTEKEECFTNDKNTNGKESKIDMLPIGKNGTINCPDRDNQLPRSGQPIPINYQLTTVKNKNTMSETSSDNAAEFPKILLEAIEVLEHLNEVSNKKLKTSTKSHLSHIKARLREGHSVQDLKMVIEFKHREWLGTEFYQYMMPKTLFSPSKFDGYLSGARLEAYNG